MLRALALLALLLAAPPATAQQALTLDDLEAPTKGAPDTTWRVRVTEEEADQARAIVYRNGLRSPFNLSVIDAGGNTVYADSRARGVGTFPALPPGDYTFLLRFREGEFQVVRPAFGVNLNESMNGSIRDGTDAYVVAVRSNFNFTVSGDIEAEWFDIRNIEPEHPDTPFTRTAIQGNAYVLTLRGDEDAPYSIGVEATTYAPPAATPDPGDQETPGISSVVLLVLVALAAMVARHRRHG